MFLDFGPVPTNLFQSALCLTEAFESLEEATYPWGTLSRLKTKNLAWDICLRNRNGLLK